MNQNTQEKNAKKIVICYEDGSQKELKKGMAFYIEKSNKGVALDINTCYLTRQEFMQYLEYVIDAYEKIKELE